MTATKKHISFIMVIVMILSMISGAIVPVYGNYHDICRRKTDGILG